jgi:hypothetical protein
MRFRLLDDERDGLDELNVTIPVQPQAACPNCRRAWIAGPPSAVGYCWHGQIAWRIRVNGEFITAAGVDRVKHLAIVRALRKKA